MEYRPCTAGGHHNVTSLNLKGDRDPCSKNGFREVFIRCNGDEVVEFIRVRLVASIQGSAKELSLGCVIPASWPPLAAGVHFMQPRDHSVPDP